MELAWFSLEHDGLFVPDYQELSDDPFVNAGISEPGKGENDQEISLLDNHYLDISDDDDFQILSSQKRQHDRYVLFHVRISTLCWICCF